MSVTSPTPTEFENDAAASCVRCGYNLIGLDDRRPCPECGLLVGFSRLDPGELRNNRPRWLLGLTFGAATVAMSLLLLPLAPLALNPMAEWRDVRDFPQWNGLSSFSGEIHEAVIIAGLGLLPGFIALIGIVLLTRLPARGGGGTGGGWLRVSLLLAGLLPLVLAGAPLAVLAFAWDIDVGRYVAVLSAPGALLLVLLFVWLRRLAWRAPAPLLAADSPVVGVAAALLPLLPLIVNLAFANTIFSVSRSMLPLVMLAVVGAVALTGYLWAIYLLIRYAFAFNTARRQAREAFAAADLSRGEAEGYHPA